jgi:hypothetical protein
LGNFDDIRVILRPGEAKAFPGNPAILVRCVMSDCRQHFDPAATAYILCNRAAKRCSDLRKGFMTGGSHDRHLFLVRQFQKKQTKKSSNGRRIKARRSS